MHWWIYWSYLILPAHFWKQYIHWWKPRLHCEQQSEFNKNRNSWSNYKLTDSGHLNSELFEAILDKRSSKWCHPQCKLKHKHLILLLLHSRRLISKIRSLEESVRLCYFYYNCQLRKNLICIFYCASFISIALSSFILI